MLRGGYTFPAKRSLLDGRSSPNPDNVELETGGEGWEESRRLVQRD
jgi:hypothetical protein